MTSPKGPFKPTTQSLHAVHASSATRRAALEHALIKLTGDPARARVILEGALADFGAAEVPDDDNLFGLLVRGYVVSGAMPYGSIGAIEAMIARLLA